MHLQAAGDRASWQRPSALRGELARAGQCPRRGHRGGHLLAHFSSVSPCVHCLFRCRCLNALTPLETVLILKLLP